MFTPQQIDQISFDKAKFGKPGYDMEQIDEFLEPLTEDYVTLYKENALLKSKMRVLVGKLEEYRKNEASMKEAVANAQKTCDKMVMEAEAKCAKMMAAASAAAAAKPAAPAADMDVADEIAQNIEALVGTAVETAPKPTPKHPTAHESTTSKFASLNLQFGRNYDPKAK